MAKDGSDVGRRNYGVLFFVLFLLLLLFGRKIASLVVEYQWWSEIGQVDTWLAMLQYEIVPIALSALLIFAAFWMGHARSMKLAGTGLGEHPGYAKAATLVLLILSVLVSMAVVNSWTVVLHRASLHLAETGVWRDPVFQKPLHFYLFDLPFYSLVLRVLLTLSVLSAVVYWGTWLIWTAAGARLANLAEVRLELPAHLLHSRFVRGALTVFLLALAVNMYLGRFEMLTQDHGFMVGMDYVNEKVDLPLQWVGMISCLAAIGLIWARRFVPAVIFLVAVGALRVMVPGLVHAVHVRPNELSLQKPYIQRHIESTRTAYNLAARIKEAEFPARLESRIDPARHKALLDNIRLWDLRAFHDTITQIQALRPYYVFHDTDIDRYVIDGEPRQVMLTSREIDVRQLPADAASRWMNPHFIYTHGYGLVLAETNRITADGLPVLFIQDAPPSVKTESLKLTRPEVYYGEVTHEPIFVRTGQQEFNYPSGSENVHSRYDGKGGFPISSLGMRFAAALSEGDWNILLTSFLTPESRMMIRRNVAQRMEELASFVTWDPDPYLVITEKGRLVWMIDGYTTSAAYPYSRSVRMPDRAAANYLRNAVKATVDAYDGEVRIYVFDPADPIIQVYRQLFPKLMSTVEEMPADLRAHARYPEYLFRAQAEIYRTFHMREPESFYNKEDSWDLARYADTQEGNPVTAAPVYVMATLPGETKPEFLLMIAFTPRTKDNLIGLMLARCDGEHLGELVFLQLSKQALIFGPMQIEARINQDQNISKDLTLWNQQGSRVLRGQMLVLPVEDTFLYVEPIYLQASQAKMPQLKKIAMAMGNRLIYADTWEQAIAELAGMKAAAPATVSEKEVSRSPGAPAAPATGAVMDAIRSHLRRYRELAGQGKWAEAGKELEAVEGLVRR